MDASYVFWPKRKGLPVACFRPIRAIPEFNLSVNLNYGTDGIPMTLIRATIIGQLRYGDKVIMPKPPDITSWIQPSAMFLLCPKLTDIHGQRPGFGPDNVEVPAGSGRYYRVMFVDDWAKGFPNEYRIALILAYADWPSPIP